MARDLKARLKVIFIPQMKHLSGERYEEPPLFYRSEDQFLLISTISE
jgi:hypothetical protein